MGGVLDLAHFGLVTLFRMIQNWLCYKTDPMFEPDSKSIFWPASVSKAVTVKYNLNDGERWRKRLWRRGSPPIAAGC